MILYDDNFLKNLSNKELKNFKYDLIQEIKCSNTYNEMSYLVHKIDKIDKIISKRKSKKGGVKNEQQYKKNKKNNKIYKK